ncbi:MAG: hypothetical protein HZB23_03490 [Deltaproteobacteria bacterium]|nr:hypothetical protein [Deltaproteobacteria bacterium]
MAALAQGTMIFHCIQAVLGCATFGLGKMVFRLAVWAPAFVPACRAAGQKHVAAMAANAWIVFIFGFGQLPAGGANENIFWVPRVNGKNVARKKVNLFGAFFAFNGFDPQEVFYGGVGITANSAFCPVQPADFPFKLPAQGLRFNIVGFKVKVFDFLFYNPVGHGIDVKPDNVAPDAVGFQKRSTASHEWVGNSQSRKIVGIVKCNFERSF